MIIDGKILVVCGGCGKKEGIIPGSQLCTLCGYVTAAYKTECWEKQEGKEFISLREFLLLKDPYKNEYYTQAHRAHEWVALYEIAKLSFDEYGENGPPVGTKVSTLRAGFGCYGPGVVRIVSENTVEKDGFIKITDKKGEHTYIVHSPWWLDIVPTSLEEKALSLLERKYW